MTARRLRGPSIFVAIAALFAVGCSTDYPEIPSGQIRAFRIPVLRPDGQPDSTLCLFSVPAGYDPDRSWPVLVALHGYGSGAEAFHDLWYEAASSAGYVLVTPQGEQPTSEGIGWAWGPRAEHVVRQSMDAAMSTARIDRSRVFLTGFSQGGWLTYRLALKYPHVFRGIAPLGAGRNLPDSSDLDALRDTRIYIGHGGTEPGLEEVRKLAAMLRSRGCTVVLREYANIGHGLPEPITDELRRILEFLSGYE